MTPIRFLILAIAITFAIHSVSHAEDTVQPAIAASIEWLSLVDKKMYDKSWDEAAPFFKEKVSKEEWTKTAASVREPLGALVHRELIGAQYSATLPGAPDGEYVVIQYKTSFDQKAESVETITPMRDKEGTWRVSGYFIR